MRRLFFFLFLCLMGKVYPSYTFMLEPSCSFLYTYDRNSALVSDISVTIDRFAIDFIGSPSVYLPPEIQKDTSSYFYENLNGVLTKGVKSGKDLYFYCGEELIGKIKKDSYTSDGAKFVIYDREEKSVALAYLDRSLWHLVIVKSEDKDAEIAYLHKYHQTFLRGMDQWHYYGWKVEVREEKHLDPALLFLFAAYIGDTYWGELRRPVGQPHWEKD